MRSERIKRHINRLLLDPNNYRFIDRPEYSFVPDDQVGDSRIQQRTSNFIAGRNNENISDLIASLKTNGVLDIDVIQVKKLGENYVVLEGNRRICTLKFLYEQFLLGHDVGKLTEIDFKSVSLVEIIDEDPVQHLITMGLHHISGKKKWSAVNEAQLIEDLIYKYHKTESEVCDSLGITIQALRRSTRTLALIAQYKQSDFGDQFQTPMFSIFEATIGNPVMKKWLGWDDNEYYAYNSANLERFFSWLSKNEEIDHEDDLKIVKEPIITQYRQIKEVSSFINDEKALARMEDSRSIAEGYTFSNTIGEAKLREAIENIKNSAKTAFNFNEFITPSDYEEIYNVKLKLDALIPSSQALILINDKKPSHYNDSIGSHFSLLNIQCYRKLQDVRIKNLNRINIFAGGNNMGKTSMLEAFFLSSQLNDLNSYLDLERYRGKFLRELPAVWLDMNFMNTIELNSVFDDLKTSVTIKSEHTSDDIERSGYLSTITSQASVEEDWFRSSIHLYSNKDPELRYESSKILCRSAFTSPYRFNSTLLQTAHTYAVKEGYFERVKSFIINNLDSSISNIELVSEAGENRFMVSTNQYDKPVDLTKYGEGLQRVFEIALLLGFCENGILCIDEIDSAIHKSLLLEFTKFIQVIANDFNVQVFISTHSKECIDAFIENQYMNDQITAYALTKNIEGKITCKYVEGSRLEKLIETIDFDIR